MTTWPANWPPFLFGAATSSHQIEGGQTNDWTRWEALGNAKDVSGRATDHWARWREDFDLLVELGLNSYRFSVEWSRIEPFPGQFNTPALAQYRAMLVRLRELGITPLLTLHHFTLPLWVSNQGGLLHPKAPEWFARYVTHVVHEVGDLVDLYITINEPLVMVVMGYLVAIWPPGHRSFRRAATLIDQLARVHQAAYTRIKELNPGAWAGLAHHVIAFEPWTPSFLDRMTANVLHYLMNRHFIDRVGEAQDFYGINYYTRQYGHWSRGLSPIPHRSEEVLSDLGWELYPEGLSHLISQLGLAKKPILITENGIATRNDALRSRYLTDHLAVVSRLQEAKFDVRGYFHWSLLDNFEWAEGFAPRFGLVEVDYDTMDRRVRDSAQLYSRIAHANHGRYPIIMPPGLIASASQR